MGNSKKKRKTKRNRKIGYNSLGMLAIALVVLVLLGGLMHEIENEQARTEDFDKLKEYMQTDEYVEEIAREKLGLAKDNETVFKKEQ